MKKAVLVLIVTFIITWVYWGSIIDEHYVLPAYEGPVLIDTVSFVCEDTVIDCGSFSVRVASSKKYRVTFSLRVMSKNKVIK